MSPIWRAATDVCTLEVSSAEGAPDVGAVLPGTGGGSLMLLLGAGTIIALGSWLVWRQRDRRPGVLGLFAVLLLGCAALTTLPVERASAAEAGCELIAVDEIQRPGDVLDLLPGDEVEALRFEISNPTAFAVDVTIATTVTGRPDVFTARLTADGETASSVDRVPVVGPLNALADTSPRALAPGTSMTVVYAIAVADNRGNDAQDQSADFTAHLTATGP